MPLEPFDERTQDWEFVHGSTINLLFDFGDEKNIDLDLIASQGWNSKFNIEDPLTYQLIAALQKTHNDVPPSGNGVYYLGDSYGLSPLGLTKESEVGIVISAAESLANLKPGLVYPYYFKFFVDETYSSEFNAVKGVIKITKRAT
jgi:hypothetical protein